MVDRPQRFSENPDTREFVFTDPTEALLNAAIATFPIEPEFGELNYVALSERREEEYLEVCRKNYIIPHTRLELVYRNHGGFYDARVVEMEKSGTINPSTDIMARKQRSMMLFFGGRMSNIKIETDGKGLSEFNNYIRPHLYDSRYQVQSVRFAVNTYSTRDNMASAGGTYMDTGVEMSRKEIHLQIGECSDEQKEQLVSWYHNLKEKFVEV